MRGDWREPVPFFYEVIGIDGKDIKKALRSITHNLRG